MTLDDIITLTKAGFSKEDIVKLTSTHSDSPSVKAPEAPEAAPTAPAPAPEQETEKEDLGAIIEQKIGEAFKPFENLYNNIAVKANMPTIGSIEPRGVEDIISDFFNK